MFLRPFQGATGATIAIANATSASASAALPEGSETVVLYNSSSTATAFFRCQTVSASGTAGQAATAPVPGTNGDFPIPPLAQIRIGVGPGFKKFSVIASAADGTLYITPGAGN